MQIRTGAAIILGVLVGLAIGLGLYTFVYAKGYSYLTNNPDACANCHVMQDYYSGWVKSTHRSVAVCNDCHTPASLVPKYLTKANNGFWHSFYFTSGRYPDPLQITKRNRDITEQACRKCHQEIVFAIEGTHTQESHKFSCVRCHGSVGHPAPGGVLATFHNEEIR